MHQASSPFDRAKSLTSHHTTQRTKLASTIPCPASPLWLTRLSSLSMALSCVLLSNLLSINLYPAAAVAQTLDAQEFQPTPETDNSRDLLEEARDALINRQTPASLDTSLDRWETAAPPGISPDFDQYRLGPGDGILFNVLPFADLSFQGTLDLQGNILVPLAGMLNLEGLTLSQAETLIQAELNRFVIDPEVNAILLVQRPVQVTILGEVVRPGLYPLAAPQIAVALASAGGTTRLADLRVVRIRRTLSDGSVIEQDVDLYSPLREARSIPDLRLADGDTVIIPTLTAEDSLTYDRTLVARSTLAQDQIVIRVLNYVGGGGGFGQPGTAQITGITLPNGSTFLDALIAISPNPDQADMDEIALIRFDPVSGRAVTGELDAKAALLGDNSQNPPLENHDVIVVGRNLISRLTYALNTLTQPFRDILGFLLFFDSISDSADNLFRPGGGED